MAVGARLTLTAENGLMRNDKKRRVVHLLDEPPSSLKKQRQTSGAYQFHVVRLTWIIDFLLQFLLMLGVLPVLLLLDAVGQPHPRIVVVVLRVGSSI